MPDYIRVAPLTGLVLGGVTAPDAREALQRMAGYDGDVYVKVGEPDDTITEDDAPVPAGHPVAVQLIVHPLTDGYRVQINSYAETTAEWLETALAMALPYIRDVVRPDPLERLWRGPSAPSGPPDMGGPDE